MNPAGGSLRAGRLLGRRLAPGLAFSSAHRHVVRALRVPFGPRCLSREMFRHRFWCDARLQAGVPGNRPTPYTRQAELRRARSHEHRHVCIEMSASAARRWRSRADARTLSGFGSWGRGERLLSSGRLEHRQAKVRDQDLSIFEILIDSPGHRPGQPRDVGIVCESLFFSRVGKIAELDEHRWHVRRLEHDEARLPSLGDSGRDVQLLYQQLRQSDRSVVGIALGQIDQGFGNDIVLVRQVNAGQDFRAYSPCPAGAQARRQRSVRTRCRRMRP